MSQNKIHSAKWGVQIAGMIFQTRSKARGCGIEKIKDSCEEAGNPMPEYTIKCEDIMVMFKSLVSSLVNHTNQATNQTIPNEDNSIATRILKVIETEPMLSQKKNRQYYRGEI